MIYIGKAALAVDHGAVLHGIGYAVKAVIGDRVLDRVAEGVFALLWGEGRVGNCRR